MRHLDEEGLDCGKSAVHSAFDCLFAGGGDA